MTFSTLSWWLRLLFNWLSHRSNFVHAERADLRMCLIHVGGLLRVVLGGGGHGHVRPASAAACLSIIPPIPLHLKCFDLRDGLN